MRAIGGRRPEIVADQIARETLGAARRPWMQSRVDSEEVVQTDQNGAGDGDCRDDTCGQPDDGEPPRSLSILVEEGRRAAMRTPPAPRPPAAGIFGAGASPRKARYHERPMKVVEPSRRDPGQ